MRAQQTNRRRVLLRSALFCSASKAATQRAVGLTTRFGQLQPRGRRGCRDRSRGKALIRRSARWRLPCRQGNSAPRRRPEDQSDRAKRSRSAKRFTQTVRRRSSAKHRVLHLFYDRRLPTKPLSGWRCRQRLLPRVKAGREVPHLRRLKSVPTWRDHAGTRWVRRCWYGIRRAFVTPHQAYTSWEPSRFDLIAGPRLASARGSGRSLAKRPGRPLRAVSCRDGYKTLEGL